MLPKDNIYIFLNDNLRVIRQEMRTFAYMKRKQIYIAIISLVCCTLIAIGVTFHLRNQKEPQPTAVKASDTRKKKSVAKDTIKKVKPVVKQDFNIIGTLRDTDGKGVANVIVSDGYNCVKTDSLGRYKMKRDSLARFIYYCVPADCEVPTHSATDRTACFYQPVSKKKKIYDFTLKRLSGGKEISYKMIVIGDPQVTNAYSPYYTSPTDNPIKKSDVERFTTQTMADIKQTIKSLPAGTPIYGLSMGDDVQYYGGYNAHLERQIRQALGSSEMRLFSVIGNHDQDGKALYRRKWEENFGPTDYSFDRGDEHFVCINNCFFYRGKAYYSPGELRERQMRWLKQDLALTPKDKKVVLCYHIPFTFGNAPFGKAKPLGIENEKGHYSSSRLSQLLALLRQFEGGYELFCGHTHFACNHEIRYEGEDVMEHCHAAACGNIWQSNINICGTPNGYYVYQFIGTRLTDCYYKGTFWDKNKQMTIFRAQTDFNGESYAEDWGLSKDKDKNILVANVFNADSHWRVVAIEDGKEYRMHRISSKGQDAFAAGYHHKYSESVSYRFVSKGNSYLLMNHLYYYVPKNPNARITIKASDPYGHTFTAESTEAVSEPFFNYAHYYEQENQEYKKARNSLLRDSTINRQKDSTRSNRHTNTKL